MVEPCECHLETKEPVFVTNRQVIKSIASTTDGVGTMLYSNGDFYTGEWFEDQMHGKVRVQLCH